MGTFSSFLLSARKPPERWELLQLRSACSVKEEKGKEDKSINVDRSKDDCEFGTIEWLTSLGFKAKSLREILL